MKLGKENMLLYAVTDRSWLNGKTLANQVEDTLRAGTTILQLREKNISHEEFVTIAKEIKTLTDKYNVPLIINDDVRVASEINADGVHVGQSDMEAGNVREILGKDKIIGVSVQTIPQAIRAYENGADYLGVGAVFSTSTKLDASDVSKETLAEICKAVPIPIVAIGGISKNNILELKNTGIAGVAVVSAIFAQADIPSATAELLSLAKQL